jgi:DNA-binding IclR family transcriptional regulator
MTGGSVQSVQRALELLAVFSARHPRLALKELAAAAGIPKSTARRLAVTLIEHGFLEQAPDGTYALGEHVIRLAAVAGRHGSVEAATSDTAQLMAHVTGQTVIVARVNWAQHTTTVTNVTPGAEVHPGVSQPGRRTGFAAGSIGKALLASQEPEVTLALMKNLPLARRNDRPLDADQLMDGIDRSRAQGWATSIDEFLTGVSGVAVPVSLGGQTVGAIAVVAPSTATSQGQLDEWGRIMRNALRA